MYAIIGITGQVGGAVARNLLNKNQSVRAVVRDASKGITWADRGCTVAVADLNDAVALTAAFADAEGVFVMIPAKLCTVTRLRGSTWIRYCLAYSDRSGASGQSCLPVYHWRTVKPADRAHSASNHGAGIRRSTTADRFSPCCLVYGKRGWGRSTR